MPNKQKVLVTGSNGFVGSAVVEAMFLSGVYTPIAGVSSFSRAAKICHIPIEIQIANVLDKKTLTKSLRDVETVVHCAAGTEEVIIQGTENILSVSKELGVKKVVHISTVDVYGNVSGIVDETFPLKSKGTDYSDWKIKAEKICHKYIDKGLPITILRPAIIYGPYSQLWTLRFAERFKTGHLVTLDEKGEGKCNLIYINDLVDAIFKVIPCNDSDNNVYNVVGDDIISWNTYFEQLSAELSVEKIEAQSNLVNYFKNIILNPIRSMAKFILSHFEKNIMYMYEKYPIINSLLKFAITTLKGNPSKDEQQLFQQNITFNNSAIKNDLFWKPKSSLEFYLKESTHWLSTYYTI